MAERQQARLDIEAAVAGARDVVALADEITQLGGQAEAASTDARALTNSLESLALQRGAIENFRAARTAADEAGAALTRLRADTEAAQARQQGLQTSLLAVNQALEVSRAETDRLRSATLAQSQEVQRAKAALDAHRASLESSEASEEELAATTARLTAEYRTARDTLKQYEGGLKAAETTEKQLGTTQRQSAQAIDVQQAALDKLAAKVASAEQRQESFNASLLTAQDRLRSARVDVDNLDAAEAALTRQTAAASAEVRELGAALVTQRQALTGTADAFRTLGVESSASLSGAAAQARTAFESIRASGTASVRDLDAAFEALARRELEAARAASSATQAVVAGSLRAEAQTEAQRAAVDRLNRELSETSNRANAVGTSFNNVLRTGLALAGINLGANLVGDLVRLADEAKTIEARLKLATRGTDEFNQASADLLDVSQRTGTALASNVTLFARLSDAVRNTGGSTEDAIRAVETISQAFAVSGGSAQSAEAAIIQLSQGLASGTLRGEELNSVLEQAPRLAKALADGLGVTTGQLRELAAAGKLTPEAILDALETQGPKIAAEFEQIPKTVSRAVTELRNAFLVAVGTLDEATGGTTGLATVISDLSTAILDLSRNGGLEAFGGAATAVAGAVQVAFNTVTAIIKGFKATVELAAGGIALALGKITPGDIGDEFEAIGRSLIAQSEQTAASIEQDNRDIEAGYRRVADGAIAFSDGVNQSRTAADSAGESLDALDVSAVRLAADVAAAAPAADEAALSIRGLGDVAGEVEASVAAFGESSLATLAAVTTELGATAQTAEDEARGAADTYREINKQLDAEQQARDAARAASVAQAESEYSRLRTAVLAATDLGEIQALRAENTRLFAEGTVGFTEYRQVIADADAQLQQLTVNTGAGFDALFGLIGGLRQSYAEVSAGAAAAFDEINLRAGRSGVLVGRYLREVNDGVIRLNQSVAEQAQRADTLLGNLQDVGGATITDIRLAQQAAQSFTLLDQTRLGQLQSAIDAATQRLERLRDTARDTVSGLQDELDQLRGNEDAIQARRDAARKAEIQAQLDLARQLQDREAAAELERSLALLQEISRERDRQTRDAPRTAAPTREVPVQNDPGFLDRPRTQAGGADAVTRRAEVTLRIGGESFTGLFPDDQLDALLSGLEGAAQTSVRR